VAKGFLLGDREKKGKHTCALAETVGKDKIFSPEAEKKKKAPLVKGLSML